MNSLNLDMRESSELAEFQRGQLWDDIREYKVQDARLIIIKNKPVVIALP